MTRPFHDQVEALRRRVLEMGSLARLNVMEGVRSLVELDRDLAARVVEREQQLNRMDVEIERDALDLVALNQPVAKDLRTLGAILKIITYLDRIGRYGYDIAKAANEMAGTRHPRKPAAFLVMAEKAMGMLDAALAAFRDQDAGRARSVAQADETVDALYEQSFRDSVATMMEDPRAITACSQYILVARHLERAADNAAKIAEKTLYMVTGERRLQV
jgi:phosphate transport system protein